MLGSYGIGLDELKPRDAQNNPRFASHVDFEWGYQQINGNHPGAGPGSYRVAQGDTLQGIARAAYGDARQWYRIAEANGLNSDRDLKVGQSLVIPSQVSGTHNASDTFEPYDPARIVGDTSPTLPVPQGQGGGCGGLGMVIMVVVAVVVSIYTNGAGVGLFSEAGAEATWLTIGEAAVQGAARSIVTQAVGKAVGVVDHFSWKQVALSALSAGFSSGLDVAADGTALARIFHESRTG